MTTTEVLTEIQKMPLPQMREVAEQTARYVREQERIELTDEEIERREREFELKLLAEGFIISIPPRDETDEDDDFEPIEFEGEPLSEMIIRERR